MTWIHDPYKHKLDGRSYNNRIGKPYYGDKLRRVIAPEPTDLSVIERLTDWYSELTVKDAKIVTALVIAAVFCAAIIVLL
jgi:hypothetical protein